MTEPTAEELGYADKVFVDELGDTSIVVFRMIDKVLLSVNFFVSALQKLHNPIKDLTAFISVGGFASLMAFNLSLPGVMPCGVSTKPR